MLYVWDPHKATSNFKKHGVSFAEACSIFKDPFSITFADPDHSIYENRFLTIGFSKFGKVLVVSHTEEYRIIARRATKSERVKYEEE